MAPGRSARPAPGLAVEKFPGDVQVTGMSRGLLDHMQHDPAHIRRLMAAVPAPRQRRQRGHCKHRVRAGALVTVEADDLRGGQVADECCRRVIGHQVLIPRRRLGCSPATTPWNQCHSAPPRCSTSPAGVQPDGTTDRCHAPDRAQALTGLAPQLPADLLARALAAATAIPRDYYRARALTGIAPQLPEADQPPVLARALAAATAITRDSDRAQALTGLAPQLPADLLAQAQGSAPRDQQTLVALLKGHGPFTHEARP